MANGQPETGEGGIFTIAAGGVGGMIKDRWWKKEFEEFKETKGAELQESFSQIGEMVSDETFEDVGGIWGIYQSSVSKFMDEVGQYPDNPYISQMGERTFNMVKDQFGDLTQGIQQTASAQRDTASAEIAQAGAAGKRGLVEAQTDAATASAEQRRAGGAGGALLEGKVTYGNRKDFANMHPSAHLGFIKRTKPYSDRKKERESGFAMQEWQSMDSQSQEALMVQGIMNAKDYVAQFPGLTAEQEIEFDKQELTQHMRELGIPEQDIYERMQLQFGMNRELINRELDDTKAEGVPALYPSGLPLESGSPTSQRLTFRTTQDVEGMNLFDDPPDFADLEANYKGSPAHVLAAEYRRRRSDNMHHNAAVEDLFTSIDEGGSGIADVLVGQVFSGATGDRTSVRAIDNWRLDTIKMLTSYEAMYDGTVMENELSALQSAIYPAGGTFTKEMLLYTGAKLARAGSETLKWVGKGFAGGTEAVGEFLPYDTPSEELAKTGLRVGTSKRKMKIKKEFTPRPIRLTR